MKNLSATPPKKPFNPLPVWFSLWIALLWLIVFDLDISLQTLLYGLADMAEYFSRYAEPDFSDLSRYLHLMMQTIATALWGTLAAFVSAFLLAPFAARNLTPNKATYRFAREVLNFLRAMPDLL